MNIIICGGGRVGFSISKQLSAQGHSITVIDQSSEFIQKINDHQDVKGVVDWSITVMECPWADNCFEIEKPTLPAPHIIIFIN